MLVIQDEEIVKRLQALAEREHRSVEEVLKNLLTGSILEEVSPKPSPEERVKAIRHKAYAKARKYWELLGDTEKASLTDEQLDEQFGRFDEEGVPRLKSEMSTMEPPVGSLAYAAKMAEEANLSFGDDSDLATHADEILNAEFADYLLKRMERDNADE
jgi:hypothetical protein